MVFDEAKFQHELSGARQGLRRDLREAFAAMNAAPWLKAVKVGWFEVEDMKESPGTRYKGLWNYMNLPLNYPHVKGGSNDQMIKLDGNA